MTDSHGAYEIDGLEAGAYQIGFRDDSGTYLPETFARRVREGREVETGLILEETSALTGINASLSLPGSISGTVTGPDGSTPLASISVRAYYWLEEVAVWHGWGGDAVTGADGRYTIENLPARTYRVTFRDDSGTHAGQAYSDVPPVDLGDLGIDVVLLPGVSVTGIDASLAVASEIVGMVTGPDGLTPLEGIEVVAVEWRESHGSWEGWGHTGADGRYQLSGLGSGPYRLGFRDWSSVYAFTVHGGAPTYDEGTDLYLEAGTSVVVNASMELSSALSAISGRLTGPPGYSLTFIEVEVFRWNDAKTRLQWTASGDVDMDGSYTVAGLSPGEYRVRYYDWNQHLETDWYRSAATGEEADIVVPPETTVPNIDASLNLRPRVGPSIEAVSRSPSGQAEIVWTAPGYRYGDPDNEYLLQENESPTNEWMGGVIGPLYCPPGTYLMRREMSGPAAVWRIEELTP